MQHGFGLLSGVLCDFWEIFHGWLHTVTSKKHTHQIFNFLDDSLNQTVMGQVKRVYVTFLEWYPIIYAWVSTEVRQPFWKFSKRFVFFIYFVNHLVMIPVHDFAKCVTTIEFGPFYLRFHAWLSTRDQKMSYSSRRADRYLGSNFMALIMLGKLLSSLSDRKFGPSCFSERMIEKNFENKGQF